MLMSLWTCHINMYPCLHRRCLIVFLRPQLSDELCLFQVGIQTRRKQNLIEIRESILAISHLNQINQAQLQTLLTDRNFCLIFFRLFDDNEDGVLEQGVWFGKLKYWYQVSLDVSSDGFMFNLRFRLSMET